jgi:hypothetical protein
MEWTMFFLFVALKVPLLALCWIVWWAIHAVPEEDELPGGDGGGRPRPRRPHPLRPLPRTPRRGPHGEAAPPSPPRVRPVYARARELDER